MGADSSTNVLEIASNDGYLLQYLSHILKVLGVEPATNIAKDQLTLENFQHIIYFLMI